MMMIRRFLAPFVAALALAAPASAQVSTWSTTQSTRSSLTPVVTSGSAYSAGNEVGPLLAFTSPYNVLSSGVIETISIAVKSTQSNPYTLCLFYAQPTATTWGDKTTPTIAAADVPLLAGCQTISAYSNQLATSYFAPSLAWLVPSATTTLYGVLFTQAAVTYSSVSDLTITLASLPG